MITAIVENCIIARLWRALSACWRESGTYRLLTALGELIAASTPARLFTRAMLRDASAARSSFLYRLCLWINRLLGRIGAPFKEAFRRCGIVRLYKYLLRSRVTNGSLLLGEVFCPGMRVTLLYVFAFYLPIDWALRDVLKIAALASVWDEAFLLFTILYLLTERAFGYNNEAPRTSPVDGGILFFMGLGAALMIVVSPRFYIAFQGYRATVQYLLWFFLVLRLFKDRRDVMRVYKSLVLIASLIALHGIYQFIVAVPIPAHWQTHTEVAVRTRVFSIFGSPNIMGTFMVLFAPMTAALAYSEKKMEMKVLAWALTVLMCFACLFTFSRGAWLGMAVAVILFAILVDRRLLLLLVIVAAGAFCVPDVRNRILFLFTDQFAAASKGGGRQGRWQIGMSLLREKHPFLGFGLGRYGGAVAMNNKVETRFDYYYLDNYYMRILVEMGYAGLIGYLIMLANSFVTALRSVFRTRGTNASPLCAGMLAGMSGVMAHCLYENIFEEPYMMAYFWGMAAMICFLGFIEKKEKVD